MAKSKTVYVRVLHFYRPLLLLYHTDFQVHNACFSFQNILIQIAQPVACYSSRKLATVSVVQFIFQLVKNFHSSFMVVCAIYCYAHYVNGQKLIHAKWKIVPFWRLPIWITWIESLNPTIFNIIRWLAGSMGRMTHRPSVWCSKHYFL